jgi:transcriptional regulator with XRE-family HTH domain
MTQADLADRLGFGRTSITNLENGEQNPPISVLPELAHALGVEPEQLIAEAMGRSFEPRSSLEAHVADADLRRWASSVITDPDSAAGEATKRGDNGAKKTTRVARRRNQ